MKAEFQTAISILSHLLFRLLAPENLSPRNGRKQVAFVLIILKNTDNIRFLIVRFRSLNMFSVIKCPLFYYLRFLFKTASSIICKICYKTCWRVAKTFRWADHICSQILSSKTFQNTLTHQQHAIGRRIRVDSHLGQRCSVCQWPNRNHN